MGRPFSLPIYLGLRQYRYPPHVRVGSDDISILWGLSMFRLGWAALVACLGFCAAAASAATYHFNVAPVVFCDQADPGCDAPEFDHQRLSDIFATIDIGVTVLETQHLPTSLPTNSSSEVDPLAALTRLNTLQSALGFDPSTVYVGFTGDLVGNTIGLAYVHNERDFGPFGTAINPFAIVQNNTPLARAAGDFEVPSNAVDLFGDGRLFVETVPGSNQYREVPFSSEEIENRFVADIVGHEVAHVLGAGHFGTAPSNLLFPTASRTEQLRGFTNNNRDIMLASSLLETVPVSAVPLPAPMMPLAAAVVGLGLIGRRRRL